MAGGLVLAVAAACGQQPAKTENAPAGKTDQPASQSASSTTPAGKKEYVFRGKVEQVDPKAQTLTVANENIEGWMSPMTMSYKADKPDVYDKVKVGDQITAKVYDNDYLLHDVQVVKPQ